MLSPKVVLTPIDFSDFSMSAADAGKEIASRFGAEILLLHVVPVIPKLPDDVSILNEGSYENELIEDAKKKLSVLTEKWRQEGVRARAIVGLANDAATEIVRTAESEKADLIVIPTHGTTGWRRVAFGSVAEKVVHTADCPVLVLRSKESAGSAESESKSAAA